MYTDACPKSPVKLTRRSIAIILKRYVFVVQRSWQFGQAGCVYFDLVPRWETAYIE